MALYINSDVSNIYFGSSAVKEVYFGSSKVWPEGLAVGTVFDFDYTGSVQSVDLPAGKYKLQCWGAQGGTSYESSNAVGSKGGYSEGILTLTSAKTLYVFVGGKGSRGSTTSLINGGWNGGGASIGYSEYGSSGNYGYSCPACGGGATDICTTTSSMSYSSGRTNRSSASLLSRMIVAGGGAGGSYAYEESSYSDTVTTTAYSGNAAPKTGALYAGVSLTLTAGHTYTMNIPSGCTGTSIDYWNSINNYTPRSSITASYDGSYYFQWNFEESVAGQTIPIEIVESYEESDSSTYIDYTTGSQQGGGTKGRGNYPGSQSSAGGNGGFGYGENQTSTNYKFCSGGAGGGWYGGGVYHSDSSMSAIRYSGGGSGFVNISSNSSYRPSGYTGLQLDSGTTSAGNTSFPSTSGGTETGHSGNGYARITVLDENGNSSGGNTTSASIRWSVQSGDWRSSSNSNAVNGEAYTSVSPGTEGSTVIRCTFSGISSITFNCISNGESNWDYLTIGGLDQSCTRDSYNGTLKGSAGTSTDFSYSCSTDEHYVEFCYSKDSSVDTSPDNATVYVKSYS